MCTSIWCLCNFISYSFHSSLSSFFIFSSCLIMKFTFCLVIDVHCLGKNRRTQEQKPSRKIGKLIFAFPKMHKQCQTKFSTSWKFSRHFAHIFSMDWDFLTKFGSSNPSFHRCILAIPYL